MENKNRYITAFDILMINIVSVVSLKNVPITAKYGLSIVFIYLLVSLVFLIPVVTAVSELSTKFLQSGGISVWIDKAFGNTVSSCVVFMQWAYNIIFFPTITVFAATQASYFISHILGVDTAVFVENKMYLTLGALVIFWLGVLINLHGIVISSILSGISAVLGVILPILLIILLALGWLLSGHEVLLTTQYLPNNQDNFSLIIIVFFSLIGVEVASAHADKVQNPKQAFPRALYFSALIIPILLILVNLSVSMVIPSHLIDDRSGVIETFDIFFTKFNLPYMKPVIALVLTLGSFGCLSSWMLALSKYLQRILGSSSVPMIFVAKNKYDVPINILIMQGVVYSVLCSGYLWLPSIKGTYLFLSSLSAQVALLANAIFFMAAIKLRLHYEWNGAYQLTKCKYFSVALYSLGCMGCFVGVLLGFFVVDSSVYWTSISGIFIGGVITIISIRILVRLFKFRYKG